jgi:hypothetical protein
MTKYLLILALLLSSAYAQTKRSTVLDLAALAAKKHLWVEEECTFNFGSAPDDWVFIAYPEHALPWESYPLWIAYGRSQEEAARDMIIEIKFVPALTKEKP